MEEFYSSNGITEEELQFYSEDQYMDMTVDLMIYVYDRIIDALENDDSISYVDYEQTVELELVDDEWIIVDTAGDLFSTVSTY